MKKQYKGLIFDCDGTLADTMPLHYKAWTKTLENHGVIFTEKRFYELGGVPTDKILKILSDETGIELNILQLLEEKEERFLQVLEQVKPIEIVVEIAKKARGKIPMAVATGGHRRNAERTLKIIGVLDWFETVVAAEDVPNHKPAPDPFLEAALRIGVDPKDCCGYEDTDLGMQSIRAAGMDAVDIRALLTPS